MHMLIILSKIIPTNKFLNGIYAWGQQSIALFITFIMFLIYSIRYNHYQPFIEKKEKEQRL